MFYLNFVIEFILTFRLLISDQDKNFHYVVDCGRPVMKEHCYWPLVSDLNNVLSHRPVALKFMADDSLLEMWFTFLSMFQGTYYYSWFAEILTILVGRNERKPARNAPTRRIWTEYLLRSVQCWIGSECVSDVGACFSSYWCQHGDTDTSSVVILFVCASRLAGCHQFY